VAGVGRNGNDKSESMKVREPIVAIISSQKRFYETTRKSMLKN